MQLTNTDRRWIPVKIIIQLSFQYFSFFSFFLSFIIIHSGVRCVWGWLCDPPHPRRCSVGLVYWSSAPACFSFFYIFTVMTSRIRPKVNAATDASRKNVVYRIQSTGAANVSWFLDLPSGPFVTWDHLVYAISHIQRLSHLWGCSPPWPWPALPANARRCRWSRHSREPPRRWRRETGIPSSPPGPELQHSGPERTKENVMKPPTVPGVRTLSLGTPVRGHTGMTDGATCSFLLMDKRREEGDNPHFQISFISLQLFFVVSPIRFWRHVQNDAHEQVFPARVGSYLDSEERDISTGRGEMTSEEL